MNRLKKRNVKVALIVPVIAIAVFLALDYDSASADDVSFSISLPDELASFAGQTQLNSNASIECRVKQITHAIDSTGITAETSSSKLLIGNPLLSVTTTSGVKMAGYVVEPRIFCSNTFNDDNLANPDSFTFIIDPSSLILQVSGKDKDGVFKGVYNQSFKTASASIPIGSGEKSLGGVGAYSSQIEANLQDGSYPTTFKFDLRGNLVVYWKAYPTAKYTIPINLGDIVSYHNARIEKGSTATTTFTGDDTDGDGIKGTYDKCPTQPETYNGYNDGDGCPDTAPVITTTTTATTSPIIYTECLAKDNTWHMYSTSSKQSFCAPKLNTVNGVCGFYDIDTKTCYTLKSKISLPSGDVILSNGVKVSITGSDFKSGGICYQKDMDLCVWNKEKALGTTSSPTTVDNTGKLTGKILWTGEVKYADVKTESFSATGNSSPLSFSIPLQSLVGSVTSAEPKKISEMTLHPVIKFDDATLHKQMSTKASTLTQVTAVNVKNSWIVVYPIQQINDYTPSTGTTHPSGIPLGNIVIRFNDVENKVPLSLVGQDDSADAILKVSISGTVVINHNNGNTIKAYTIQMNPATLSSGATFTGESFFEMKNLKVVRGTGSVTSGHDNPLAEKCQPDETGYIFNGVLLCQPKGLTVTDDDGDGVIDESSGGTCAGLTPEQCIAQGKLNPDGSTNVSSGGMCPLDSGTGDSNGDGKICQICTDPSSSSASTGGGFPCDQAYRENYCNNSTTCNTEPKAGDDLGNNIVVTGGSNSNQCNLGKDAQGVCITDTNGAGSGGNNIVCFGKDCNITPPTLDDPNLIWYGAGLLVLIGIIAIAVKKRR